MSQGEKSRYFRALKDAGVTFEKHYREYNTAELKTAHERLVAEGVAPPLTEVQLPPAPVSEPPVPAPGEPGGVGHVEDEGHAIVSENRTPFDEQDDEMAAHFFGFDAPVAEPIVDEQPGMRLNTAPTEEILEVDEEGRAWIQKEVRKPSFPKPRGRRVLTVMDSGVQEKTVSDGRYTETFEIPGDPANARPTEIKVTLPSYQVGQYRSPRFPFKVHVYNGVEGFDLFEVADYYGGAELVPATCKRIYVENVLCYDIRSVVRAINDEYRTLQLQGKA